MTDIEWLRLVIIVLLPPAAYGIANMIESYRKARKDIAYWEAEYARAAKFREDNPQIPWEDYER